MARPVATKSKTKTKNKDGIFSARMIEEACDNGKIIIERPLDEDQVQPASLDLRLGKTAFRVRASFLPGPKANVRDRLEDLKLHEIDLTEGAVLEVGCVYIVPLLEALNLSRDIAASTNPKSSTGRLDIFTRVISDKARAFDKIAPGYKGQLFLEVSPRTFPILVRTGTRLSQIRFRRGDTILDESALKRAHKKHTLIFDDDPQLDTGVAMSIDLKGQGRKGLVGYRAKHHTGLIDVDKKAALKVLDFWEPIYSRGNDSLILDPDEFYILVSKEAVHVPPEYAAEMVAIDPLVGEFRVHYAGFFDPGFGHDAAGGQGSRAVLEVRSHEVPFILEHGQTVGRLIYEKMAERPALLYGTDLGSNYQAQTLKLSKHFKG